MLSSSLIEGMTKYMLTLKNMSNIDIIMNEEKPKKPVVVLKKNIANINDIFFPKTKRPIILVFLHHIK